MPSLIVSLSGKKCYIASASSDRSKLALPHSHSPNVHTTAIQIQTRRRLNDEDDPRSGLGLFDLGLFLVYEGPGSMCFLLSANGVLKSHWRCFPDHLRACKFLFRQVDFSTNNLLVPYLEPFSIRLHNLCLHHGFESSCRIGRRNSPLGHPLASSGKPSKPNVSFQHHPLTVQSKQATYNALTSPLRKLPGPFSSHLTNLPLKHAVTSGRRIFHIDALHRAHGPIVRLSPTEVAVGADVPAFRAIHGVQSKFKKDVWYERLTNFPRLSVFTMRDPREHGARRRLFARGFSKSYLREVWEPAVREKVAVAVSKIGAEARAGRADLMRWWTFMATDVVGVLGFGESFGMLEAGRKTEYIRVLEAALVGNGVGAELPWVRAIGARVPVRALREAFNSSEYILAYGTKAVENARRGGRDANLMATIMAEAEKGGGRVDDMVKVLPLRKRHVMLITRCFRTSAQSPPASSSPALVPRPIL